MRHDPASADALPHLNGAVVIFDLDGTLVDTAPDLHAALNHVLVRDGFPACDLETVRAIIGHGARAMILKALARLGTSSPESTIDRMLAEFLAYYTAHIADHSRLYPDLLDTLETLRNAGATLVIATNKPDALTHKLLDALELTSWFTHVVGATSAPTRKPSASHLAAAAGDLGLARAIMIGDSETDYQAAHNAGVPVILMEDGYSDVDIRTLGAEAILNAFKGLPTKADELLETRKEAGS